MAPIDAVFDANTIAPRQGGAHPVGNKFTFRITDTSIKQVKDKQAGYFQVEFTSEAGSINHNYNLWNESEVARRIANEQLSALCHAVGIFKVDFKNDGAALRGATGLMDIGFQKGHEPSAEKPEGGYVELKKVYDRNGNEPGKAATQPQQQTAPQTGYTAQTGFAAQSTPQQQQTAQQANPGGWQPQQNAQQTAQPANNAGGWQQGTTDIKPPWG